MEDSGSLVTAESLEREGEVEREGERKGVRETEGEIEEKKERVREKREKEKKKTMEREGESGRENEREREKEGMEGQTDSPGQRLQHVCYLTSHICLNRVIYNLVYIYMSPRSLFLL